jgi:hypothetical protein
MNKIISIISFILIFNFSNAQDHKNAISVYGQKSFIGGSLEFDYSYSTGSNNSIYAGVRYRSFEVRIVEDTKNWMFQDRFVPVEVYQNFGLILGDEYYFTIPQSKLRPFLFYHLQMAYMGIHNEFTEHFGYTDEGYEIFIVNPVDADPMFVFENNLGLGGKVKLYKNLDFAFRIGAGVAVINLTDPNYRVPAGVYTDFSKMGSLGLSYKF